MSRVYAGDARLMAELATERRIFVPYSAIPELVKQAFVSAEDQNFWIHPRRRSARDRARGVHRPDAYGAGAAAGRRLHHHPAGREEHAAGQPGVARPQGASEAILAMRIEQYAARKQRILELYLNEIYLGLQLLRRRRGGAGLFQQAARQADDCPKRRSSPRCRRRPTTTIRSGFPMPPRRGATGCSTGWRRTTRSPRPRQAAAKADADRPGRVPPAAADPRRRLVRRGGAPPADRRGSARMRRRRAG